ncbi:hypothetical protein DIPPA_29740 [Diplonema papillatum]|nr:hypothetical protein DIPPA_29740 [Diplonema papillatum]
MSCCCKVSTSIASRSFACSASHRAAVCTSTTARSAGSPPSCGLPLPTSASIFRLLNPSK